MSSRPPQAPDAGVPQLSNLGLSVPVAMGYVPLGAVFGFLFMQAGAQWWMPMLASVLVYAGAAQFMMIPLVAGGASLGALVLATLVINFRHVFYGLSLLHRRPDGALARWYQAFSLTDETYAVVTTLPEHTQPERLVWIGGINHMWWVLGTAIGVAVGAAASLSFAGLDFALTALFAVLLVEQLRANRRWGSVWAALLVYALMRWWVPQHALMLAMAVMVVLGAWWPAAPPQPHSEEPV
jgi:4-azaleucine resistance transporter AzlC